MAKVEKPCAAARFLRFAATRTTRILPCVLLAAAGLLLGGAPVAAFSQPLTAEQDHRRLLDLAGIRTLRPGADGRNETAPNAANYDEAKAGRPALPDPLRFDDGRPVRSAADWPRRRAEIVEAFDREVYGRVPASVPEVRWRLTASADETVGGVPAVRRDFIGEAGGVAIALTVTSPKGARRTPAVLELVFLPRPGQPRPPVEGYDGRTEVLRRGWTHAALVPVSVQPDDGAGLARGIIGAAGGGQPRDLDDWGALRAWAWGASRALDRLGEEPAVDGRRVSVAGLSRYGKAALVTMAYDQRFAAGFIGSSGAGGAKLLRRDFGERVENLAGAGEYHWMAGNFLKYAGPKTPADLPVDAHELIALAAPRPVFLSVGRLDAERWTDPRGMFLAGVAASPVWRLLGKRGLTSTDYPPMETALTDGELAWRQHSGGHTLGPNWPAFLDFAARYLEPRR